MTVALSGDGGDEVFGGYLRYTWARALWRRLGPVPRPARRMIGSAMRARSPEGWDAIYGQAEGLLPKSWRQARPGEKLHKLARVVDSHSGDEMYERLASTGLEPSRVMTTSAVLPPEARGAALADTIPDLADRMMYLDLVGYLPDDILVKVDRASMAVSLESRAPLLDHRLIEWAWTLPQADKLDGAAGKIILRRLVSRYVPPALLDRPKMGFAVPIDVWLRGALRPWAEDLLDPARLRREGYFQPDAVQKIWAEHLVGRREPPARALDGADVPGVARRAVLSELRGLFAASPGHDSAVTHPSPPGHRASQRRRPRHPRDAAHRAARPVTLRLDAGRRQRGHGRGQLPHAARPHGAEPGRASGAGT